MFEIVSLPMFEEKLGELSSQFQVLNDFIRSLRFSGDQREQSFCHSWNGQINCLPYHTAAGMVSTVPWDNNVLFENSSPW